MRRRRLLDAKADTTVGLGELESLRKELEDLEEKVRATKQRIQEKEASIARSQEEAAGLRTQLKN